MTIPASSADIITTGRKITMGQTSVTPPGTTSAVSFTVAHGLGVRPTYANAEIKNFPIPGNIIVRVLSVLSGNNRPFDVANLSILVETSDGTNLPAAEIDLCWIAVA